MKCTAPCIPGCGEEATHELLSLHGAHLGYNCDRHLAPLRFEKVGNLEAEYKKKPLAAPPCPQKLSRPMNRKPVTLYGKGRRSEKDRLKRLKKFPLYPEKSRAWLCLHYKKHDSSSYNRVRPLFWKLHPSGEVHAMRAFRLSLLGGRVMTFRLRSSERHLLGFTR